MARRRSRSGPQSYPSAGRDVRTIARTPTPVRLRTIKLPPLTKVPDLRLFEDRRRPPPDPRVRRPRQKLAHPFGLPRAAAQLMVKPRYSANVDHSGRVHTLDALPSRIGFRVPDHVAMCVRRKRRREVLHALGIAGRKGVGRGRKQTRNEFSEVGC